MLFAKVLKGTEVFRILTAPLKSNSGYNIFDFVSQKTWNENDSSQNALGVPSILLKIHIRSFQ
jgi:hypothetical protein